MFFFAVLSIIVIFPIDELVKTEVILKLKCCIFNALNRARLRELDWQYSRSAEV